MDKKEHLFLTGYRGTGKSTVGRLVANHLALPCIDLDDEVEKQAGRSIRQIFEEGGEEEFRDLETSALHQVSLARSSVIALGGGAILRDENREVIAETGSCFWLDADAETILSRLRADATTTERRPALTDLSAIEEIRDLLDFRRPLYLAASDFRLEVAGRTPEQIAREVVLSWQGIRGST